MISAWNHISSVYREIRLNFSRPYLLVIKLTKTLLFDTKHSNVVPNIRVVIHVSKDQ
jgi:hypothetical protein